MSKLKETQRMLHEKALYKAVAILSKSNLSREDLITLLTNTGHDRLGGIMNDRTELISYIVAMLDQM